MDEFCVADSGNATLTCVRKAVWQTNSDLDTVWLLLAGILVFFMQCGFTMLECGCVRVKNVSNIIFKTTIDLLLAALVYWICGWAFAYGGDTEIPGRTTPIPTNGFIGFGEFCLVSSGTPPPSIYANWFFQFAFTATAATIVSGAVAERIHVYSYCLFSCVLSAFIYPVVVHWVWSANGWLSAFSAPHQRFGVNGMLDFAGSGVVHLTGGVASFVGAAILGPRIGRFPRPGESWHDKIAREELFRPHNRVLASLGTIILWFGWYGFNAGSTLALSQGAALIAAKVAVNTTLSAAVAGLTALISARFYENHLGIDSLLNGILAGLVSITAGCSLVEPWAAVVAGAVGGVLYFLFSVFMVGCRVDDPLQASAVHGMCGIWGCFFVGLFATAENIATAYGKDIVTSFGAAYGGGGEQLGVQCVGILCIVTWVGALSALIFGGLRLAGVLRVPPHVEEAGLDTSEHGGSVYELQSKKGMAQVVPDNTALPPVAFTYTVPQYPTYLGYTGSPLEAKPLPGRSAPIYPTQLPLAPASKVSTLSSVKATVSTLCALEKLEWIQPIVSQGDFLFAKAVVQLHPGA